MGVQGAAGQVPGRHQAGSGLLQGEVGSGSRLFPAPTVAPPWLPQQLS